MLLAIIFEDSSLWTMWRVLWSRILGGASGRLEVADRYAVAVDVLGTAVTCSTWHLLFNLICLFDILVDFIVICHFSSIGIMDTWIFYIYIYIFFFGNARLAELWAVCLHQLSMLGPGTCASVCFVGSAVYRHVGLKYLYKILYSFYTA